MTTHPKTPAQRLARVFRILAVLAEREVFGHLAQEAAWYARTASDRTSTNPLGRCEKLAETAARTAGIDPETIQ